MADMSPVCTPARTDFPVLMTAADVAEILRVSPRTVRRWGDEGHLETVRLAGHAVRFTARGVTALIALTKDQAEPAKAPLGEREGHVLLRSE